MLHLAQGSDPVSTGLLQYGAVGILALVLLIALRIMWTRYEKALDDERKQHEAALTTAAAVLESERKRGDRMETELLSLNKLVSTELSGHLVRATEAMREVTDTLRHRGDK